MYPALPYGKMVTLRHRVVAGQDEYNNETYAFTEVQVGPCSVQQGHSGEEVAYTDRVTTDITVYVPYGTDVGYLDAIIVDDVEYEVTGDPSHWMSPFSGRSSPIRVFGQIVKGASM
jgi:SPP1 family predicted phage head-tail adaptor